MSNPTHRRHGRSRAFVASAILLALTVPSAVLAGDGNNGTVKIHDGAGESTPITHNDPHVGCAFHLHFLFGDGGQAGAWQIRSWPPTGNGTIVASGTYSDPDGDGADRQDATVPAAGHYKLFWDGDTGKHDKMKVFWSDCAGGTDPNQSPDQ